jgi:hypothetical protein
MELSKYREAFAGFNSANELAQFEYRTGLRSELMTEPVFDRYGDLFTKDAIASLSTAYSETPVDRETDRAALHSLLGSARIAYQEFQAREIAIERSRCEAAARISWNGESVPAHSAIRLMANERDKARRRELLSRYVDSFGACNDLRAEYLECLHASAGELGFDGYQPLFAEITGVDFEQLAATGERFLILTEPTYERALARELAKNEIGVGVGQLTHADFIFLQKMHRLDRFFPASELLGTYSTAMRALGIKVEQQLNISIDLEIRPGKNPRAACFRIDAPQDIRLSLAPLGGPYDYSVLFHEAGHAQHFGWSSESLVERFPEFLFAPENATSEGYAYLFQHFLHDPQWLMEHRTGMSEKEAGDVSRSLAFLSLYSARRYFARLSYEMALHRNEQIRSEQLAQSYSDLQTRATLFARPPGMYLMDVDDGFYSAAYLRAWAFEAGLREHLKTRYGSRWWTSRKAGDDLIDLWSTSSRYTVEELASLIGFGDLNFDLLAEQLIQEVEEE